MLDSVTLDQLRVLVAVADAGSFTAAAKRVRRAQSAVSHAIAGLEDQLGLKLFDRSTKRPRLTPLGQAVLADARTVLTRVDRMKARAQGLSAGLEPEITFAMSVVAPQFPIIDLLREFRLEFPSVCLRLFVEEVGGASELVAKGDAHLGLVGKVSLQSPIFERIESTAVGFVDIVAVAEPGHPLAAHTGLLTEAKLQDHRQLVPTSRALPRYPNRLVNDVWEVADLALRHEMLRQGLGWGTLPAHLAEPDIAAGRLARLDISARPDEVMRVPLFVIHRTVDEPGPARRWLIERLASAFQPNK